MSELPPTPPSQVVTKGHVFVSLLEDMLAVHNALKEFRASFEEIRLFLREHPEIDQKLGDWQRARRAALAERIDQNLATNKPTTSKPSKASRRLKRKKR